MSRIQIPVDILTSRLNLSDKFASVRAQSIKSRFANLKPISEFLDLKRLSKPANFGEVQSRVNYNLGHFSSNYAVIVIMLSIYSLLTNFLLLFVIILVVGGMWGIGKLDGSDLDIGFLRATSSQLYTGLLVVAVPLGIFASPISTILWLIGASGVSILGHASFMDKPIDEAFSGEAGSRRRKQWERERALWEDENRVEELDSDDTDTQGVGLSFGKKRFASDPLEFTGIDLAMESRARRGYAFDDGESSSEDSEESENEGTNALQIALRDKEEALVQSALRRIRRAQEKGKREVKLNQDELDALEKRRKRMQASNTKAKKESRSSGGSGTEKKRRSDRSLITVPLTGEPSGRKRAKSRLEEPPNPPGLIEGPDGLTYAPVGYYPVQAATRNSPSRPRSASSQQLQGTGRPSSSYQTGQIPRHFSDGMRPTSSSSTSSRRPLPDDEDWIPGSSRRSSVSSQSFPVDPFEYQTSEQPPPIPQQYMQQGRRIVSGPPEVSYSSLRRSPPFGTSYPAAARSSGSDPALRLRDTYRDDLAAATSEDDDDSDDLGNGVQVFVEERGPERERTVSRKPVSSGKKKGKR
ncbi:uncharacterized protein BP5553_06172 [Venustampulla echinocandica]|uniref:Prenylated Rab acceptor 1 n=1 Tax=Venustampulla echinocandica TaxID=2656787 RepID=A0A370TMR0_9HELO|nr:uncharacterized protein BP5553_06172 [Venustampulla echinocandica]RDL36820.1 hypothetical protein BP5553_06172 [Venustampulla echinocandica]